MLVIYWVEDEIECLEGTKALSSKTVTRCGSSTPPRRLLPQPWGYQVDRGANPF